MTVTDELMAELELCESCDCGFDMDRTDVKAVLTELRRLRADNAELEQALAESRANDQAAMGWLTSLRWASGDRGERMLPELVTHIEGLAKDAGRYRWLRLSNGGKQRRAFIDSDTTLRFDEAVDSFMATQ